MTYDAKKRRERYLANREKEIARQKARNRDRASEIRDYQARYYAEHAETLREKSRKRMRKLRKLRKNRKQRAI